MDPNSIWQMSLCEGEIWTRMYTGWRTPCEDTNLEGRWPYKDRDSNWSDSGTSH